MAMNTTEVSAYRDPGCVIEDLLHQEPPFVASALVLPEEGRVMVLGRDWMMPGSMVRLTGSMYVYECEVQSFHLQGDGLYLVCLDIRERALSGGGLIH